MCPTFSSSAFINFWTSSGNWVVALQFNSRATFEGSAVLCAISDGRKKVASLTTKSRQSSFTLSNAFATNSSSDTLLPVAITKSSGASACSIRHITSTYSGAHPQSRTMSNRPKCNFSTAPLDILQAADTIFLVTNLAGRKGDSWLKRIPLHANKLYDSR